MRIAMVGAGYVGLVSGACFAEFGVDVCILDTDAAKIEALRAGRIPIYEPGLESPGAGECQGRPADLHHRARRGGARRRMRSSSRSARRRGAATGMPTCPSSSPRPSRWPRRPSGPLVLVTKSTVPVGTGRKVQDIVRQARPDMAIEVASNPEFLREGSAIGDFMRPDRVVIGTMEGEGGERAMAVLRRLYRPLNLIEVPILATRIETAELIKYAANAFLATKITFINEIADLCEKVGADVHDVARGMGLDGRIGRKFLHAGPGYGGSCFPKDTLALARTAAGFRRADQAGRDHDRGERGAQGGAGRARDRRLRRQRRRQGDRGAGPDLQAGDRRHAGRGVAGAGPAPGRGGGDHPRLRPGRHGRMRSRCCPAACTMRPARWMPSPAPMRWCC